MERLVIDEAVRTARERLAEGRKGLIEASPAAMESCAECLRDVIADLRQCRDALAGGGSWQHKLGYNGLSVHLALKVTHHGACQVAFCLVRKR